MNFWTFLDRTGEGVAITLVILAVIGFMAFALHLVGK